MITIKSKEESKIKSKITIKSKEESKIKSKITIKSKEEIKIKIKSKIKKKTFSYIVLLDQFEVQIYCRSSEKQRIKPVKNSAMTRNDR